MLLGNMHYGAVTLHLRGFHPLRRTFPEFFDFSNGFLLHARTAVQAHTHPTTPRRQHLPVITPTWFSLIRFRSPLLTESRLFSLPVGTEMFHFPTFPPTALYIQAEATGHDPSQVSPFGHPRITARLPTPQGLSQAPTSFIGFWCQGIHRVPLVAFHLHNYQDTTIHIHCSNELDARIHCTVLKKQAGHPTKPPPNHQPAHELVWYDAARPQPTTRNQHDPSGPNSVSTETSRNDCL